MKASNSLQSAVTKGELENYKKLVKSYEDNDNIVRRHNKNVLGKGVIVSKEEFWRCFVICILTTQAKSGEDSPLQNFIKSKPNIINYNYCVGIEDVAGVKREIPKGVPRFLNRSCKYIYEAISKLGQGFWKDVEQQLNILKADTSLEKERNVADFIRKNFKGIGRKQSRNIIQVMGLSKYVLPIDSRVMATIEMLSGISLDKKLLEKNYIHIEDRLQEICNKIGVYPCIFDACAFYSQGLKKI